MRQVLLPRPPVLVERTEDASAYKESAEDKEDDDSLIAGSADDVGWQPERAASGKRMVFNKQGITSVMGEYKQRGDSADCIECH